MSYWIDPIEWIGLFALLTMGMLPTIFLLLCGAMKDWQSWFGKTFVLPWWSAPPLAYSAMHAFFGAAISISVWLLWLEALRTPDIALSALGSLGYDTAYSGDLADPTWLLPFIFVLYLAYIASKVSTNFCFWICNVWLVSMIINITTLLTIAGIAVTAWFIWWVPALLLTLAFLFDAYTWSLCVGVYKAWNDKCEKRVILNQGAYLMTNLKALKTRMGAAEVGIYDLKQTPAPTSYIPTVTNNTVMVPMNGYSYGYGGSEMNGNDIYSQTSAMDVEEGVSTDDELKAFF